MYANKHNTLCQIQVRLNTMKSMESKFATIVHMTDQFAIDRITRNQFAIRDLFGLDFIFWKFVSDHNQFHGKKF